MMNVNRAIVFVLTGTLLCGAFIGRHFGRVGLGKGRKVQKTNLAQTPLGQEGIQNQKTIYPATASQGPFPPGPLPSLIHPPAHQQARPAKRAWDPGFLFGLDRAEAGSRLRFELVNGEMAAGAIDHMGRTGGEVTEVAGKLSQPEPGRFVFQKQTRPGVAGDFVGVVEFPASQRAYRIEPSGPSGSPELVERSLAGVVCWKLPSFENRSGPHRANIPPLNPGAFPDLPIPGYQNGIPLLESLHGAAAVIYLDFQGGYTETWGGITYERPAETKEGIREIWERVAEDFLPFNINITTDLQAFENAPLGSRQRIIITPTMTASPEAGGVAYVGTFNWTGEMPAWVFITTGKACAEACSHEAGHTLGLSQHDGQDIQGQHVEYYTGQGDGPLAWAPIMGNPYYRNVSQWCHGGYPFADNDTDELSVIVTQNNVVRYRTDDTGDTLAASRYLELYSNDTAGAEGVIETTADIDAFQFTTRGGSVSLRADPAGLGPDLALSVSLYDAQDQLVASNCPQDTLSATLDTNVAAGTYTFRVTGAGRGDPLTAGFGSYGSIGYYSVTGSVSNARLPDRFAIPERAANDTVVGRISAQAPGADSLAFIITSGNYSNTFAIDNSGLLTVADNRWLDYATLANRTQLTVQFELFVDILDASHPELSETNRRVVIALLPVPGPPVIIEEPTSLSVLAGRAAGLIVTARENQLGYDPLVFQWFLNGAAVADASRSALAIPDAQAENAGDYTVAVTNSLGAVTSVVATVTVIPAEPFFVQQPSPLALLVGEAASYAANAVGTEPIAFQWRFNGSPLGGQTHTTLDLGAVNFSNAGSYQLIASNSEGVVASAPVDLQVSSLLAWGGNDWGQTNVPQNLSNVVQVSAGARHNLLLLRDGRVLAWGTGAQTNVPPGLESVVALSGGGNHSLALRSDGTVVAWGDDSAGQVDVPPDLTNIVAIAAGGQHSLALKANGTVSAWGQNSARQCSVPPGLTNVIAIAAGTNHSLALLCDGTVLAWGDNTSGQCAVPPNLTNVIAITAGAQHSLALRADGTLSAWGDNTYGQAAVLAVNKTITAIAAGAFHNLALATDSSVIAWGAGVNVSSNFPVLGQAQVPAEATRVAAIAAGAAHSLILVGDGAPFVTQPPVGCTATRDSRVVFRASATGSLPLSYQWQLDGTNIPGAFGQALVLNDATNAGDYRVLVSNSYGQVASPTARLALSDFPPQIRVQPLSQTSYLGNPLRLAVVAIGSASMSYQWRFNGLDLPGATNSILIFNPVEWTNSGIYSVVISNSLGWLTSAKANVQVAQVAAWGDDHYGQTDVPTGLAGIIQVACGDYHSLALRADGTVVGWGATGAGFYSYGQTSLPPEATNVIQVAAGGYHSLALREDGTVVAWGAGRTNSGGFNQGQSAVPAGLRDVVAVAAGTYHSVALKSDGEVVVWGGQAPTLLAPPKQATGLVAIGSSGNSIIALRADGTLVGWGASVSAPSGQDYVGCAPGVGLRGNGIASSPYATSPALLTNVLEVAGGTSQFLARKADGTVVAWGSLPPTGVPAPPSLTNAIAIGCGRAHSLVAVGDGSVQITMQPRDRIVDSGGRTLLTVLASGAPPLRFQWRFDGTNLPSATNFWLRLINAQFTNAGHYSVVVSNPSQSITSRVAVVSVRQPVPVQSLAGALDAPTMTWTTSTGTQAWFGQPDVTHDGMAAAQSGPIGDTQTSDLQTHTAGPATLSFWWKVSSEELFDFLTFSVNGKVQASISGEVDWQFMQFDLPATNCLLNWTYTKDASVGVNSDAGWLDQVTVILSPPQITTQPLSQTLPMGSGIYLNVKAAGAPPLTYQWLKNAISIAGATNSGLLITNATRHDSGQYAVSVSDAGGTTTSVPATILIRVPQALSEATWVGGLGFTLISRDADGGELLPGDLAGFEAQTSTNLLDWSLLTNSFTLTNGSLLLVDPASANDRQRFYRIIEH